MTRLKTPNTRLMVAATCSAVLLTGCAAETTGESKQAVPVETAAEPKVEPEIQMTGPVIYLADNLNEEAKRGWCIDTQGRGQSDQLHSHSCKPEGEDTQHTYDSATSTIRSVAYDNQCMTTNDPENSENTFGLVDCADGDPKQKFTYDADNMEIRIGEDPSQCVAVAENIDDAGPYQSRDLIAAPCQETDASFKQWVVRD